MSYVLHLGHQETDIAGISGRISTDAADTVSSLFDNPTILSDQCACG